MNPLGNIDAEGGPLLLLDCSLLPFWSGVEGDGVDYQRACSFFDENPTAEGGLIPVGNKFGLVWEMKGAGTAYVFDGDALLLIRIWPVDPMDSSVPLKLAVMRNAQSKVIARIGVFTGRLAILWATESIKDFESEDLRASSRCCLVVPLANGAYDCVHEDVEAATGTARRLHLVKTVS